MPVRYAAAAAIVAAALMTVRCGGIVDPSKNTVETFTGTLAIGGSAVHPFSSSKNGEISVKVTALSPTSNTFVGLLWSEALSDGACSTQSVGPVAGQNNFVQVNVPGISGISRQLRYCIMIYDVGTFTVPQTYTMTVSHP
jgi:hypothetical protein